MAYHERPHNYQPDDDYWARLREAEGRVYDERQLPFPALYPSSIASDVWSSDLTHLTGVDTFSYHALKRLFSHDREVALAGYNFSDMNTRAVLHMYNLKLRPGREQLTCYWLYDTVRPHGPQSHLTLTPRPELRIARKLGVSVPNWDDYHLVLDQMERAATGVFRREMPEAEDMF